MDSLFPSKGGNMGHIQAQRKVMQRDTGRRDRGEAGGGTGVIHLKARMEPETRRRKRGAPLRLQRAQGLAVT